MCRRHEKGMRRMQLASTLGRFKLALQQDWISSPAAVLLFQSKVSVSKLGRMYCDSPCHDC